MLRVTDKTFNGDQFGDTFNGNEFGIYVFPEYVYQPLSDSGYREIVYFIAVVAAKIR